MKATAPTIVRVSTVFAVAFGTSGCLVSNSDAKEFVENNIKSCGGTVSGVTLTRTGLFSNEYTGFAEVLIDGESYTPELKATSDGFNTVLSLEQDPCASHQLRVDARRLQREAEEMQREAAHAMQQFNNGL